MRATAAPGEQDNEEHDSVSSRLQHALAQAMAAQGGWLGFDRYMSIALYQPGLGYYARGDCVFGRWAQSGSDFVTAPELTPLFASTLAVQLRQALQATGTDTVVEFGAGSGALAEGLIEAIGPELKHYCIVELSAGLRNRQALRLARFGARVQWFDRAPDGIEAVVVGNEVLDAMPVQLLAFDGRQWLERGVTLGEAGQWMWSDRPTTLRPPHDGDFAPGTVTEIHPQAEAFVASLAQWLRRGAAFFVDYGFPAAEYYHPQRLGGTLMCHRAHRVDSDPLHDAGAKDITAHVQFTGIALAAQDNGLEVLGYTSQARFLMNCGLLERLTRADMRGRALAQKLIAEHEMGELFKVIGFAKGCMFEAVGFSAGDRTHRL